MSLINLGLFKPQGQLLARDVKFRRGPCVTIHGGLRGYGGVISDSSDAGNLLVLMKAVTKKKGQK